MTACYRSIKMFRARVQRKWKPLSATSRQRSKQTTWSSTRENSKCWVLPELSGAHGRQEGAVQWRSKGHGTIHPELNKMIESLRALAPRTCSTNGTQSGRCNGSECHYITEKQFVNMRRVMCTAMGDNHGRRPDAVRFLVVGAGKWYPKVVRTKRMVKRWQKEAAHYTITPEYWDSLAGTASKLGPISLMRHNFKKMGVHCQAWGRWVVNGRRVYIGADPDAAETLAGAAVTSTWRNLAKHRVVLQGLSEGRNEDIMHLESRAYHSQVTEGMPWIIQPDSVYTPARAHLRWGYEASWPLCGAAMGGWQHYVDECTGNKRPPKHSTHIAQPALRHNGNVPQHWVESTSNRDWDKEAPARHVGTYRNCRTGSGRSMARWGEVYWGYHELHNAMGPLPGRKQTSGNALVWAAIHAIIHAYTTLYSIIDSIEVYNKGTHIVSGRTPAGRHAVLWRRGLPICGKIRGIGWVNAHLDAGEAAVLVHLKQLPNDKSGSRLAKCLSIPWSGRMS